jgi:hypothetical protein
MQGIHYTIKIQYCYEDRNKNKRITVIQQVLQYTHKGYNTITTTEVLLQYYSTITIAF